MSARPKQCRRRVDTRGAHTVATPKVLDRTTFAAANVKHARTAAQRAQAEGAVGELEAARAAAAASDGLQHGAFIEARSRQASGLGVRRAHDDGPTLAACWQTQYTLRTNDFIPGVAAP